MFAQVIVDIVHENVAHVFTYLVPEGMSLTPGTRVRVPFGFRRYTEGVVLSLSEDTAYDKARIKPVEAALEDYPAILPNLVTLAREMADKAHCPLAETLRLMLPAMMRGGRVKVKTEATARLTVPADGLEAALAAQGRSDKRRLLLRLLQDGEEHPVSELKLLIKTPLPELRTLQEQGYAVIGQREVLRSPNHEAVEPTLPPEPTPEQREVLDEMLPALEKGAGRFLLHGVTGSGKTEVYIQLVRRARQLGRDAIILVPEIALTPQMVRWFRQRFGDTAAVLHSRLSAGEQFDEWRRIRLGQAHVVIGARSAVFAPVQHLGLIVVDEEHEQSYLSDRHPAYDAREVADSLAAREGAMLLLSSATPSILSFARARRGDYVLLEMTHRVMNRPMPEVTVVDMRQELQNGNRSIFSGELYQSLKGCIESGRQAILFLNHRGYSSFVSCRSCGYVVKCGQCDIAMTYHQTGGDGMLHCHYCGQAVKPPTVCPECGSKYIRYFGLGTQKVEEEVKKLFPGVGVLRMDADTTTGKDAHAALLGRFRAGEAQVLIGTQMIAKGLDFPKVTLVGVVAADMTLNLPDYRSVERTFQLLTQVAGRAGRAQDPGRVVIQTYKPDDPCIKAAAAQDFRQFFETEFQRRRVGLYPPFTIMARLLIEGADERAVQAAARELASAAQAFVADHAELQKRVLMIRPDTAPVKMICGKHRYQVLLKLFNYPDVAPLHGFLAEQAQQERPDCQVFYEQNPASMM